MSVSDVVAEPVRGRFEHGKRVDVGLLLQRVGAPRREGNLHVVPGLLRGFLDGRAPAQNDHVSERNHLAVSLRAVGGLHTNPFQDELRECVFGSEDFLRRMVALAEGDDPHRHQSTSRRLRTVSVKEILSVTSMELGVEPLDDVGIRSSAAGRDMAAWLCRCWTGATLAELGPAFGLDGTDSARESCSPCGEAIERIGHLATGGNEDRNCPWLEHRTQGRARPSPPSVRDYRHPTERGCGLPMRLICPVLVSLRANKYQFTLCVLQF